MHITNALRWRHNGLDSVSNHQPRECLLSRLFGRRSKKTSKLRVTGLCAGNSPGTGEFPAQRASNAENVSIWWRHHGRVLCHSTGPLSDLRYRQVRLDLRFIVRMRARQAPLPPITADCHRLLPAIIVAWEISRGMATNGYQIMVVQALTEQIPEPIVFWFVIFGFVTKCVIHCMFELKDLKLEVAK